MTVKIAISSQKSEEYGVLEIDGKKIEVMRGKAEEKVVELRELVESLKEEIGGHIDGPCDVTLELSGATTIHGGGELKLLILNVDGGVERASGMKIILSFKINAKK